jgi:hypothetical protein
VPFSLNYLLQQANIGQSRSSVLNPLQWMLVILVFGVVACLLCHAPLWLVILFAGMLALVFVLSLLAYVYFARVNPDSLRSEQFSLSKLAIEKGLVGDSLAGLHPSPDFLLTSAEVVPKNPTPNLPSAEPND